MIEQKIVAELDDIRAVAFECMVGQCHARLTVPFTTTTTKETTAPTKLEIPKNCPSCHQEWIGGASSNQSEVPQIGFLTALEKVKELQAKANGGGGARFRVLLELQIPQTMPILAVRAEK